MIAGVSTACFYPAPLEESLYDLAVNGVQCTEIFFNTQSEIEKGYVSGLAQLLKRFDMRCVSVHPFTSELETLMFFSDYERRYADSIEYYKKYFEAMNILGADIFVFHGGKAARNKEFFCERYSRLFNTGKEFGIKVALENVSRCQSGSSAFIRDAADMLGDDFAFVLDTKQAVRAGEDPFRFLEAAGKHTAHVHISDCGEMGDCLLVGRGRFRFRDFFAKLSGYNPDCSIVLELYRSGWKAISDIISSCNALGKMTAPYSKEHRV